MPCTYDLTPSDIALYQRSVEYLSRLNDLDPYSREYRDVYNDFLDTIDQLSNRDFKASLGPTVAEFAPLVRPQVQKVQAQPQTPSRTAELNKAQDILNNLPPLKEAIFGTSSRNIQQPKQLSPLDSFELQLLSGIQTTPSNLESFYIDTPYGLALHTPYGIDGVTLTNYPSRADTPDFLQEDMIRYLAPNSLKQAQDKRESLMSNRQDEGQIFYNTLLDKLSSRNNSVPNKQNQGQIFYNTLLDRLSSL